MHLHNQFEADIIGSAYTHTSETTTEDAPPMPIGYEAM